MKLLLKWQQQVNSYLIDFLYNQITVGLLRWNGEDYVKPRFIGSNVVVTVPVDSTAEMIVAAAAVRHKLHNIKFPEIAYKLLYSYGSIVNKIPGTDVTFTLQRYEQFLRKPYSKITLYLAPADQEGEVNQ